jgi:polar amino acid transport system ATP-binding protein
MSGDRKNGTPVLQVRNLVKSFRALRVLDDVSITVDAGETVCIVGPSGSGKSTLLRCINLLEWPDSGEIYLRGERIGFRKNNRRRDVRMSDSEMARIRTRVGMVFQQFNLWPHLTALGNVTVSPIHVLKRPKQEVEAEAEVLLEKVGLQDKRDEYPIRLSGGQQQRVAIARALINKPTLLLADEPTGALDSRSGEQVMDLLGELHRDGQTILLVTHDAKLATRHAARVISVVDGKIVDDARLETPERAASEVIRVRSQEVSR